MPYRLNSPLTAEEADKLSEQFAFRRIRSEDSIWAEFDTPVALDGAMFKLREIRQSKWRAHLSVVDADKSA